MTGGKPRVTIHVDAEVLAWFRSTGPGWNTRINDVLREWYESHRSDKLNGLPADPQWQSAGWLARAGLRNRRISG